MHTPNDLVITYCNIDTRLGQQKRLCDLNM